MMDKKIKLIVSDLDGTLLNDKKELPDDLRVTLQQLRQLNILFYTASGRTCTTQKALFGPLSDEINFICDNGAYLFEQGKNTFVSEILRKDWQDIIRYVNQSCPGALPILCGTKGTYCVSFSGREDLSRELGLTYVGIRCVNDLAAIQDVIFKISVCHPQRAESELLPLLAGHCRGRLEARLTDPSFVDVMNVNISKGSALEIVQRHHGILPEETMVFGDYYNDIEMLKNAHYSYTMKNAPEDVAKYGNFIAPDNNHAGVLLVIKEWIELIKSRRSIPEK